MTSPQTYLDKFVSRYTSLPYAIDLLQQKRLLLANPAGWKDQQDRALLEKYRESRGAQAVRVLCFTKAPESSHLWGYNTGDAACRIRFRREVLERTVEQTNIDGSWRCGDMEYIPLAGARAAAGKPIAPERLPFIKRIPFKSEKEWRIIWTGSTTETEGVSLGIDPWKAVTDITITGDLPEPVFKEIKDLLYGFKPADARSRIQINHSQLNNFQAWLTAFKV